jgi:hypothetical protein
VTQRKSPVGYIFAGIAVVLLGFIILLVYEAISLTTAIMPPITWEEARFQGQHIYLMTGVAFALGLGIGSLAAHFWWAQSIPPWFKVFRKPARSIGLRVGPGPR